MDSSEKWYTIEELAFRWRCKRDAIIRRIQKGLIKAFHLPMKSNRRKRVYMVRLISESEVLRIEREYLGHQ